jgi:transcriptional regulator with XRE-family HTH domain
MAISCILDTTTRFTILLVNEAIEMVRMLNGDEIKRRRKILKMSQGELARRCCLSQQAISRLENNLSEETSSVGRLAAVLQCSVHDLDPDFAATISAPVRQTAKSPSELSAEISILIDKVAEHVTPQFGFRPTQLQAVMHLLTKSGYRKLAD